MALIRIPPPRSVPLQPLLPLFHRLNREHFGGALVDGGQPLTAVRWSDGRMSCTAGFYRRGPWVGEGRGSEIVLSWPVLEPLPQSATESTLCHEMIHAWVDLVQRRRESHGPLFRARMAAINAAQSRFQVSIRHSFRCRPARLAGWRSVPVAAVAPPAEGAHAMPPAGPVASSIFTTAGMPAVCSAMWRRRARWKCSG